MSIYDVVNDKVRREHRVTRGPDGIGWGCSCGTAGSTPSPNATPGTTTAAVNRHLNAAWKRTLAALRP